MPDTSFRSTTRTKPATIGEMIDRYEQWAEQYYCAPADASGGGDRKPTGEHRNMHDALRALRAVAGDLPPEAMSADELCDCQDWMLQQRKRNGEPWSRGVINDRINRIRRFFRWARNPPQRWVTKEVVYDLSLVEPLKHGRSDARETGDVQPVSQELVTATMAACDASTSQGRQLYAMLDLQWVTGMRPGELVRMRRDELAIETPRLATGRTVEVMVYSPKRHKTAHHGLPRHIFLGPEGRRLVEDWLRRIPADQQKLFTYVHNNGYYQAVTRVNQKHKIEHWYPNQIRHSFATRMRHESGIDVTQVLMGHRHRSTTEIYAAPDASSAIEAIFKHA